MLFFILKLYDERKYYILTAYFYNEKKVLHKKYCIFKKKFWNINVANIRFFRILHKTLSGPSLKSAWVPKKGLPQSTSCKAGVRKFLITLKQITQSHSCFISDCQHDFEKGFEINIEASFFFLWLRCYQ